MPQIGPKGPRSNPATDGDGGTRQIKIQIKIRHENSRERNHAKGAHRDFQTCGGSAVADDIEFELRHAFKIYARRGEARRRAKCARPRGVTHLPRRDEGIVGEKGSDC